MRVKQILFNLISNACKFTENGQINVSVKSQRQYSKDTYVIHIKDTGIGLTENQISKLFTAFTQADLSTTKKYGGTGLGLALSKQLCELLGGSVSVSSIYGKGSEFIVVLPKLSVQQRK